jgi:hypothetical protein
MTDEIDRAQTAVLLAGEAHLRIAREEAASIPAGEPGICRECDEESKRLVRGRCAPCRDDMGLA